MRRAGGLAAQLAGSTRRCAAPGRTRARARCGALRKPAGLHKMVRARAGYCCAARRALAQTESLVLAQAGASRACALSRLCRSVRSLAGRVLAGQDECARAQAPALTRPTVGATAPDGLVPARPARHRRGDTRYCCAARTHRSRSLSHRSALSTRSNRRLAKTAALAPTKAIARDRRAQPESPHPSGATSSARASD